MGFSRLVRFGRTPAILVCKGERNLGRVSPNAPTQNAHVATYLSYQHIPHFSQWCSPQLYTYLTRLIFFINILCRFFITRPHPTGKLTNNPRTPRRTVLGCKVCRPVRPYQEHPIGALTGNKFAETRQTAGMNCFKIPGIRKSSFSVRGISSRCQRKEILRTTGLSPSQPAFALERGQIRDWVGARGTQS